MPTRRPKERPTALPVHFINHDKSTDTVQVPIHEHPTGLVLFKFATARSLLGLPPFESSGIMSNVWIHSPPTTELTRLSQERGKRGIGFGDFGPTPFCQMMAKIAHSFVVGEVGLAAFRPLVTDLILGKSENLGLYVGSSMNDPPPADTDLHTVRWTGHTVLGRHYVVVYIRLFADLGAPIYHVVVGEALPQLVAAHSSTTAIALRR
jgi:hypothetical protein